MRGCLMCNLLVRVFRINHLTYSVCIGIKMKLLLNKGKETTIILIDFQVKNQHYLIVNNLRLRVPDWFLTNKPKGRPETRL
jgi:hypothetical protein